MRTQLNPDVSFCELDDQLFFLDVQRDLYFQLPRALELKFRNHLRSHGNGEIEVHDLITHGLLLSEAASCETVPTPALPPPARSVLEMPSVDARSGLRFLGDIFASVAVTHRHLRQRKLKCILQALSDYRQCRAPQPTGHAQSEQKLLAAACAFNRLRPLVPIQTRCLIDSLSMVRFLARRGLHAHLVMGIACDPFSAHAWVQYGSLVLNENLGTAQAYVPIRVT